MASSRCLSSIVLFLFATILLSSTASAMSYINPGAHLGQEDKRYSEYRVHIILVESPPHAEAAGVGAHRRWHESFLPSPMTNSGEPRLVHSYTEVFSGFAARLTDAELDEVAKKPGFLRAFPDRTLQLATTRTPAFLGLAKDDIGLWRDAGYGRGVIIGLVDTGIHAAHPSFDDNGVAPPPARWKGSCAGSAARCNNKLIGAKSFVEDEDTSDSLGHGTHTSSTAAGNFVAGASQNGLAAGTAAGIAPGAHVAMYKVCTLLGCDSSAILAGIDAAIKDGVDVMSLSLGSTVSTALDQDPIAIGAFSAVSKGITMVCAAGNNGPNAKTVINVAPWLLTVAAGSVDRKLSADVLLHGGARIRGEALTQVKSSTSSSLYPLLYDSANQSRRYCVYPRGDHSSIAGKILVCEASDGLYDQQSIISALQRAGAAGVVLINSEVNGYTTTLRDYGPGVVQVTAADGINITRYATSVRNPAATIAFNSTQLGVRPSPTVASFSSRGPSRATPGLLKPDILAPGLNILAAWPPLQNDDDRTGPSFNIISGTSMATPHISGVAALIKSAHPDWSPAAIKSAILTTADVVDNSGRHFLDEQHKRAGAYAIGAGHVNPTKAADPGLVYELGVQEYASYICSLLGDSALATIARNSSLSCAKLPKTPEAQLNYPTIMVPLSSTPFTVSRTVTNVGPAESTYTAEVRAPKWLTVRVQPERLVFSKAGEKRIFNVTVSGRGGADGHDDVVEGSLQWISAKHVVRSPIVAVVGLQGGARLTSSTSITS